MDALLDRLLARRASDGSLGYGYRETGAAEATALGALALGAAGLDAEPCLAWLLAVQRADGGVPPYRDLDGPCWPTALSLLALEARADERTLEARGRAERWLLSAHGLAHAQEPLLFGHDETLVGWSWAPETHSWVEPTAHALLALRSRGLDDHDRAVEGARLLADRCLPDGGWNYGNTRVIQHVLRAFPATTGVALAALAGGERNDAVSRSVDWLASALAEVRAPLSLGWGIVGLALWNEVPQDAGAWLEETATRDRPPDPVHDALLVLAALGGGAMRDAARVHT